MINLKNTYVPNIKGTLADLYVAEAKKQELELNAFSHVGDGWKYLIILDGSVFASNCKPDRKELTLDDFKPTEQQARDAQALVAIGQAFGDSSEKAMSISAINKPEPEITMEIEEEKMKRTVVTYEKVKFDCLSDAFRMLEEGTLYIKVHGGYTLANEGNVFNRAILYQQATTETTPMQAAKEAMRKYIGTSKEIDEDDESDTFLSESRTQVDFDYDNEYIAMIRVTLNAYDGK